MGSHRIVLSGRSTKTEASQGCSRTGSSASAAMFIGSIFKWIRAPQAVPLGALDLDRERALQIPVVQSAEWLEIDEIDAVPD